MINIVTLKIKRLQKVAASLLLIGLVASCSPTGTRGHMDAPGMRSPRHVFLIVMENHSAQEALAGRFTASLAAKYGVAND
jgi:hypothetical protein